jgi:hypothetical protein
MFQRGGWPAILSPVSRFGKHSSNLAGVLTPPTGRAIEKAFDQALEEQFRAFHAAFFATDEPRENEQRFNFDLLTSEARKAADGRPGSRINAPRPIGSLFPNYSADIGRSCRPKPAR